MNSTEHSAKPVCTPKTGRLAIVVALTALLASTGVLAFSSVPALALETHVFSTSFGSAGEGAGELSEPHGLAVNSTTHDVYVADTGNHRVDEFEADGTFVRAFGKNVGGLGTDTCSLICAAATAGSGPGEFTEPELVAVDNDASSPSFGDVYVADSGDNLVSKFNEEGELEAGWGNNGPGETPNGQLKGSPGGSFGYLAGIAVDRSGTLEVVSHSQEDNVFRFTSSGNLAEEFNLGGEAIYPSGIAMDSEDNTFWSTSQGIEEVSASGGQIGRVTGPGVAALGLAVDSATGGLYVDSYGNVVDHYAFSAPGVVGEQDGSNCTVEPEGHGCPASDQFGSEDLSRGEGVAVDPVDHTAYVAEDQDQQIDVFTGPVVIPDVTTEGPTDVSETAATLNGTVNPDETSVTACRFEYGTEPGVFGKSAACAQTLPLTGKRPVPVSIALSGLTEGTTYHYRLAAGNTNGTNHGGEETFNTPGAPRITGTSGKPLTNTTAALTAHIDPEGFNTKYRFEYSETAGYGTSTPEEELTSGLFSEQEVSAPIKSLKADTTYHFRLVASNADGPVDGPDETLTTFPVAVIEDESFSEVGSIGAALNATVNPEGASSSYYYEYGTSESYGAKTPAEDLGAIEGDVPAPGQLTGLQANTVYYLRLVVVNEVGTVYGADVTFRTLPPGIQGLPDGRVYEMVTPPYNHDAEVYVPKADAAERGGVEGTFTERPFQVAVSGDAVAYVASPTTGGNGEAADGEGDQNLAVRLPQGGWQATNIVPSGYGLDTTLYQAFSSELTVGFLGSGGQSVKEIGLPPLAAEAPGGTYKVLYARNLGEGTYQPLFTAADAVFGHDQPQEEGAPIYAGSSAGLSQSLFETKDTLTAGAVGDGSGFNLYDSSGGRLSLVNVLPDGTPEANAIFGAAVSYRRGENDFSHVISADGSRIFWTDMNNGNVYVRENATQPENCGVPADACTVPVSAGAATYQTATPDGRYAYYTEGGALWRYDTLTNEREELAGSAADVQGVIGVNETGEDGSYLYFVAGGALTSGTIPQLCRQETNEERQGVTPKTPNLNCYLYLSHDGATTLIATLTSEDGTELALYNGGYCQCGEVGDWEPDLSQRTAEVSPDGHSLVFMSRQPLTGYDNVTYDDYSYILGPVPMEEVFVYDTEKGLVCASCNPSGEPPQGGRESEGRPAVYRGLAAAFLPISHVNTYMPTWMSDDGNRVFFDSEESLVSRDTNGKQDVYEWERDGTGSCAEARGCVYLLSGGTSEDASWLVGADASGDNVFIVTRAQLVPEDNNEYYDLYDVRVGGVQPVSPPACTGTGCQGVPAAPPTFATPPSVTFNGIGNFSPSAVAVVKAKPKSKPAKCAKGRVRRRGKCIKAKAKAKRKTRTAKRSIGRGR